MEYDPKEEAPVQKEPVITAPQEPAEDRNRDTEQPGGDKNKKNPAGKPAAAAQPDSGRTAGKADTEAAEEDGRGDSDLETEEADDQDQTDGTAAETESRKKNAEEQPQNAFLYGVLTELCSYLPVTTSLKEWLKERVPFYGDCAILKGKRELSRVSFEQISTMDRAQGREPFEAIKEAVKETGGITIDAEDYRQSSFLNDVTRQNEEVLSSVVCGGTAAEGTYRYTYGLNRESYVYEASTLHAGAAVSESRPSAGSESGSFYYTETGSVANLISGRDSVSYAYDSFGSCTKSGTYGEVSRDSAAYASAYAYNGEYIHETLGLQYLRARYYDAESGSFISRDSYAGQLDDILSQNRYIYAQNNPLSYADPSGHSIWGKVKAAAKTAVKVVKTVAKAVVKSAVSPFVNAAKGVALLYNGAKKAVNTIRAATRKIDESRQPGETEAQRQVRVTRQKAEQSSVKADILGAPLDLMDAADEAFGILAGKLGSSRLGQGIACAATAVCDVEKKACKAYESCVNKLQEMLPGKEVERLIKGAGLVVGGAGKVVGAVGLAVISAPFCAAGIGVGGEIAAGITAAACGTIGLALSAGSQAAGAADDVAKAATSSADDLADDAAGFYDDIFEPQYGEPFDPVESGAIAKLDDAGKTVGDSINNTVKNSADDFFEDAADDVADFYDDIFEPQYGEQVNTVKGDELIKGERQSAYKPSESTKTITDPEVKNPNTIKYSDATDAWDSYLGKNQTNINPRTGLPDNNRLFSSDGTRSIRFSKHEMDSIGTTKAHFHYETWSYDSQNDIMTITNTLQRMR